MWIFPSPSLSAPCCLLLQGCSCVLGIWAGRGHASSTAQPLFATVSHSPMEHLALPCPRDRRDVRALRPPGMMRLFSPTSQHVQKTGKGTSFSWPRLWRLGCSFGGAKSCEGCTWVKWSSFPDHNLGSPRLQSGVPVQISCLLLAAAPQDRHCPRAERGAVLPAAASA